MSLGTGRVARRVLVSGAAGLIGRRLVAERRAAGDTVVALVRRAVTGAEEVRWRPGEEALDPAVVSGFDTVIHLAGEPVLGRWTAAKKRRILESRVVGTRTLVAALRQAERPPGVFLCASGINFYGGTREGVVDENSAAGAGFLAGVCEAWEAAANRLEGSGTRVVTMRIGVVLAREGGTLAAMLPIFRMGLGGPVGGGRGYVSWITLGDVGRVVETLIEDERLRGPVNVVSAAPVTGRELAAAIGAALGRPAGLPVPAWVVRLGLGQFAEETVLGSVRAMPRRLLEAGFVFRDATIEGAVAGLLAEPL